MILILTDDYENTTCDVIDWLVYYNQPFLRINETDQISIDSSIASSGEEEIIIHHKNKSYNLDIFTAYWYRRGFFNYQHPGFVELNKITSYLSAYFNKEYFSIQSHLSFKLKRQKHIGSYFDNAINKNNVLILASDFGLDIPATLITGNKKMVVDFFDKHNGAINKGIENGFGFQLEDHHCYFHTIKLEKQDVEDLPEKFVPVLLQEHLEKKYELRIFYLDGMCYSSVIFSQNDPKTSVDFRNYNEEKQNRVCPYNLPKEITQKLKQLMTHLDMRSGSIDIVVTTDNRYVFLEVNPVGQFKSFSENCNYHLEKEIAETLIADARQGEKRIDKGGERAGKIITVLS